MEPRYTLEQFSLLTRLLSIGDRLHQTGLPMDSMLQAIYNMEESYCLGEKLPASGTAPLQVFTHDQLTLLTRQLAIHQRLKETGLSDDSIIYSLFKLQMKTGNIDIDAVERGMDSSLEILIKQCKPQYQHLHFCIAFKTVSNLQKIPEGEESADEGKEGAEVEVIPNTDTSAEPMTAEEIKIEVDRLMG
ncbi:Hypp4490 [Branchiostoma lanceolatum]|uniref:Hypp4490 protein n=1 Tax=Branchiostoma lanceolatum TaxID=7740 RepID=A0A8K0AA41_BRALA|nr:Hypp4490 [Branchiostoma lanceolatum]